MKNWIIAMKTYLVGAVVLTFLLVGISCIKFTAHPERGSIATTEETESQADLTSADDTNTEWESDAYIHSLIPVPPGTKTITLTANILDFDGKPIILPRETIDPATETTLDIAIWKKVAEPVPNDISFDAVEYVITAPDGTLWQRAEYSRSGYWHSSSDRKGNIDKTKRKSVRNEPLPFVRKLAPGSYRVSAVLGENDTPQYAGISRCVAMGFSDAVVLDESQTAMKINVSLERGVPASFQLMDPDTKQPLGGIDNPQIRLVRPDGFRVGGDSSEKPDIRKSEGDRYYFDNLVPGEYRLLVCTPMVDSRNVLLEYCGDEFPVTITADGSNDFQMEPTNCLKRYWPWNITGTVRDENGEPVPDVSIEAQWDMTGIYIYRWAKTDDQGNYDLRMFPGFLFRFIAYSQVDPETGRVPAKFHNDCWNVTVEKKGYTEKSRAYEGRLILIGDDSITPEQLMQNEQSMQNLSQGKKQSPELILHKNKPAHGYDFVIAKIAQAG